MKDEVQIPISTDTVTTLHRNVYSVSGVYLATDTEHAATNYYTGGSYQTHTGLITLGTELANALDPVLITYTYMEGPSTSLLDVCLAEAETEVKLQLSLSDSFDWDALADGAGANQARYALAALKTMYAMNMPNAVQMGYNYRIGDVEVQTKLWGEGMIAQDLFNRLENHCRKILDFLRGCPHAIVTPTDSADKYYAIIEYL